MTSQIDPTVPVYGTPTTQSVRDNFATAKTEITALQNATTGAPFLPESGGRMTGPMYLYNDPTDAMMPVTKGYADVHYGPGGSGGGGGGIPEAPVDAFTYGRNQGGWVRVLPLAGGTLTGALILAADPTAALGAVTKQYADAIGTTANGAVQKAGSTMTGLLVLSGDPSAALGATTKQYTDAADALKANAAAPTFTGVATFSGGRNIISAPSGPSLTLYDTTTSRPCFGIYNSGGYFQLGLTNPSTGNPNGGPFMWFDQTGAAKFGGLLEATSGRIVSTSNNSPSIACVNTAGGGVSMGLWASTSLYFGTVDPAGNPGTALGAFTTSGDIFCNGALNFAQNVSIGNISANTGTVNICRYGSNNTLDGIGLFATTVTCTGTLQVNGGQNIAGTLTVQSTAAQTALQVAGGCTAAYLGSTGALQVNGSATINANVTCTKILGNSTTNGGGALQGWGGSASTICFRWDTSSTVSNLTYRINEAAEIYIATMTNACEFGYASGGGGPNNVSLNGRDLSNNLWGIITDAACERDIKTNITDSPVDALALIAALQVRAFDYTEDYAPGEEGDRHVRAGFVADEVESVMPEMLGQPLADGLRRINLRAATPFVLRAIQQLADRLDALERNRK